MIGAHVYRRVPPEKTVGGKTRTRKESVRLRGDQKNKEAVRTEDAADFLQRLNGSRKMFQHITHQDNIKSLSRQPGIEQVPGKDVKSKPFPRKRRGIFGQLDTLDFKAGAAGGIEKSAPSTPDFKETAGGFEFPDRREKRIVSQLRERLLVEIVSFVSATEVIAKVLLRV
jgi:hypothetical protein